MPANHRQAGTTDSHEGDDILALLDFLRQQGPEERIRMLGGGAEPRGCGRPSAAPIEAATLERAVCSALASQPRPALGSLVVMLSIWTGLEPRRKALLLRTLMPELKDGIVAAACGVNRSTLFKWPEYARLKAFQKHPSSVMRGEQDEDGNIEAWLDAAG
ncbi:hypothetical protein [Singulisphaera sp. PoT]|uniref:hypothetical protein n=1 Tax=Singulisphaera sp. PoT TaxID=3411797 RepID=UPI003BF4F7FF